MKLIATLTNKEGNGEGTLKVIFQNKTIAVEGAKAADKEVLDMYCKEPGFTLEQRYGFIKAAVDMMGYAKMEV